MSFPFELGKPISQQSQEFVVGNQPSTRVSKRERIGRRGRFTAPIADLSAKRVECGFIQHVLHESGEEKTVHHRPVGADKSAVGAMNRPLRSLAYK